MDFISKKIKGKMQHPQALFSGFLVTTAGRRLKPCTTTFQINKERNKQKY